MIKKIGLSAKIQDSKNLKINGFSDWQWIFLNNHFISDKKKQVYVFEDSDRAEEFYSKFKKENNALFFPDLESQIFEGAYSSERDLFERFLCISKVIENKDHAVFTTYKALAMYIPTLESLKELTLNINVDDIISPFELSKKLVSLGFEKNPTVEEPGTFSQKGEIFDIYPIDNEPFRIHYFDDLIEEIHEIDKNSLRTLKDKKLESYTILPSPKAFLNSNTVKNFLDKIPRIGPSQKNKQSTKENIIESINSNNLFQNFPLYFSLFLEESTSFYNFLNSFNYEFNIFNKELIKDSFELEFTHLLEVHEDNIENDNDEIIPDPNYIYKRDLVVEDYLSVNDIDLHNDTDITQSISLKPIPFKSHILSLSKIDHKNKKELFDYVGKYLQKKSIESNTILFVYQNKENVEKFKHYYENQQFLNKIIFLESSLEHGFIYESEKLIIVHESDLYTAKIKKTKSANFSEDVFADQLASLEEGDYVIHKSLGIGQYKGVETIEIGNQKGDFVVLHYEGEDKAYVPVYKLNLIQKHSSSEAHVKVANLNSKKFDLEKNKAKKSVKKLAFDLLELQAKREMKRGYQFSEPSDLFYEFIDKFKFKDTPDQASATEDVISDMCSHKPMDRLICGDVGFGKTEIAMRAAFKAVEDHKQVVILVPTTVLAFQHYNSFLRRFEDFPVNIEFLSRFKSPKESKDILQRLEQGKVDIIIGTHKLLSDKIKYHDLGLLVIDEEQRFGVSHKEKIKLFKENLDCLVLTATPIPRTLQMSFLGIKDLSLIKTAPPKRQSIKTYLIKEDANTLRNAINKELGRGGQIFVVHNKVKDIEDYTAKISRLNPDAKIIYAHGQLPERELEKRITDFYNHKYDILVATTIIESGIDIPSANTMIIDRADTYGLSQLHQLRGRIGRSDKKAYAYFTIPSQRNISQIAAKRLRALQTYADMGSGFSLATSDLEIRGSGDILGAEQSGHIANIGLELYMELLKETINELKNNKNEVSRNIEIQTPFNSYIDSKYIDNSGVRLKYYKKISGAKSLEKLDEIKNELSDIYGPIPEELNNLFTILAARNYFNKLPIDSIKVTSKQIHLNFNKKELDEKSQIRDKLIPIFLERPKVYNLKPNYSVICHFKERVSLESLLEFSKYIAMQIEPC